MTATTNHVVLLRGINVGGKNKVPMAALKLLLEEMGFADVTTYIQSGNVILRSPLAATAVAGTIEGKLGVVFKLTESPIKVLALTAAQLQAVVANRPTGFGDEPDKFHSDAIFLMGIAAEEALPAFSPREGVDKVWAGEGVIYAQRLSTQRTKSGLNRMMASPIYKSMTIRNWRTTTKLLDVVMQHGPDRV